jgi:hypothetical protein
MGQRPRTSTADWRHIFASEHQRRGIRSAQDNKALGRRCIEVGWNRGDLGVVREPVAPGCHRHLPGMPFPVETGAALEEPAGMYRMPRAARWRLVQRRKASRL